jgi:hypothetical protein
MTAQLDLLLGSCEAPAQIPITLVYLSASSVNAVVNTYAL